jgi:hypothetical protein
LRWVNPSDSVGVLIISAKLASHLVVPADPLIDLIHTVALVGEVPGDIAVHESSQCVQEPGVFILANVHNLLADTEEIVGELLKGLGDTLPLDVAIIVDQLRLVVMIVELLVKGKKIVEPRLPVLHHGNGCRDFLEQLLLVELCGRPE